MRNLSYDMWDLSEPDQPVHFSVVWLEHSLSIWNYEFLTTQNNWRGVLVNESSWHIHIDIKVWHWVDVDEMQSKRCQPTGMQKRWRALTLYQFILTTVGSSARQFCFSACFAIILKDRKIWSIIKHRITCLRILHGKTEAFYFEHGNGLNFTTGAIFFLFKCKVAKPTRLFINFLVFTECLNGCPRTVSRFK